MRTPYVCLGAALCLVLAACGGSSGGTLPSSNAALSSLVISTGTLSPAFSPALTSCGVGPGLLHGQVVVIPTAADAGATITVDGVAVVSGTPSLPKTLPFGATTVTVVVTSEDGTTTITTTILFTRAPLSGQEAYLKASNTDALDRFGYRLDLDNETVVVPSYVESSNATGVNGNEADDSASGSGAAYVFR